MPLPPPTAPAIARSQNLRSVDAAAVVLHEAIKVASRRPTAATTELHEHLVPHKQLDYAEDDDGASCCCFGASKPKPRHRPLRRVRDDSCTHVLATGWSMNTSRQATLLDEAH